VEPAVSASDDPAVDVLFEPLRGGRVAWPAPGRTLLLGARPGPALFEQRAHAPVCIQGFRPWAAALANDGFDVRPELGDDAAAGEPARFPLVLVLPTRQREETRAQLARAVDALAPGGALVTCAHNNEGARTLQGDLARLLGPVQADSRRHCRVVWASPADAQVDTALLAEWRELDAPRPIADGRFQSRPGVFAWDRIDAGSALLAAHLPADLAGHGADFGAGLGVLAAAVLARCPGVTAFDLHEADARALALARRNLADARVPVGFHWHDVAAGVPGRFDFVVSNPPFHQRRADEPDLGRAFLVAAAAALRPGGRLLVVANRHLPYERTLVDVFARQRVVAEDGAYKVIEAVR
jgi:16S rRNA (guanine1207-N2)-methyltransferase